MPLVNGQMFKSDKHDKMTPENVHCSLFIESHPCNKFERSLEYWVHMDDYLSEQKKLKYGMCDSPSPLISSSSNQKLSSDSSSHLHLINICEFIFTECLDRAWI